MCHCSMLMCFFLIKITIWCITEVNESASMKPTIWDLCEILAVHVAWYNELVKSSIKMKVIRWAYDTIVISRYVINNPITYCHIDLNCAFFHAQGFFCKETVVFFVFVCCYLNMHFTSGIVRGLLSLKTKDCQNNSRENTLQKDT